MSDKSTLSRAFNQHLCEFLDDIGRIVPDSSDITTAKTSFETIKKANPSLLVKAWQQKVYIPYKDIIDSGNITFFVEKDYSSDLSSVSNSDNIMKMIDKIRDPIRNMNDTNKDHCLKYIQNLSKISTAYASM
tara:strand:- start:2702 stop:3097 length:396 start_codon:yes stop_codon:yes gene_type:complete